MVQNRADVRSSFEIKPQYVHRVPPRYYVDDERGVTWQPDVYQFAAGCAVGMQATAIIDLGCGRASKLAVIARQLPQIDCIGVDYGPNLEWCRQNRPGMNWVECDLDSEEWPRLAVENPLIVCADVIEHLIFPDRFLSHVRAMLGTGTVVLSTPERDLTHGGEHNGPPPNKCHAREWNASEFRAFLESSGFRILHYGLTRSNDSSPDEHTILSVVAGT